METNGNYRRTAIALLCVGVLVAAGAAVITAESPDSVADVQETEENETAVSVQNLSAPEEVQLGESYTVSAEIENRGEQGLVRQVSYRIGGNAIQSQLVEIAANGTTAVTFNVSGENTSGLPTGTFTHGVYTEDANATANVTLVAAEAETPEETNETTTEETTTEETETTTEETPEAETANVTFEDQISNGTAVTVQSVTVPEGGFVAIHDMGIVDGEVEESLRGQSDFLVTGTHENVTIELDEPLNESQRLVAVVYRDSNGNETFDYLDSNRTEDGPYTEPDSPEAINEIAEIELQEETGNETETETDNETE